MKKKIAVFIFLTSSLFTYLFAIVLETNINTSNFELKYDGSYRSIPNFGGLIAVEEQLLPHFNVKVAFERDSELGNSIWAKLSYHSSIVQISLGPSICVLNSISSFYDALSQLNPGIIMGVNITHESGFIIGLSGNFSLAISSPEDIAVFLQSAHANIGYRFPNLLGEFRISHKGRVNIVKGSKSFFSITDYGLYTETFYKPSRLRVPINIIYRNIKYNSQKTSNNNKYYGNILFETGFNIALNSDVEFGFLAGAAIYSFSINAGDPTDIKKFFFRSQAHLKIAL